MHLMQLLQNYFEKSLPNIHAKRINRILMVADSLLSNAKLTLTSLGRNTKGSAQVKNKIKAIDRLLGNKFALQDRQEFYKSMSTKLIGNLNKIDIIVDWSPAGNHENHMLRASFALKGRSMTLYEEVHPQKKLGNYDVHKNFLKILKNILPKNIQVVVITDAGFKTDWFQLVLSCGWNFEGRIFGSMYYQLDNEKNWWKTSTLYPLATKKVKHIANIRLTKNNKLTCGIYIYREESRHKKICKPKKKGRNFAKEIKRYKQQYIQPWLIVTSLPAEKI